MPIRVIDIEKIVKDWALPKFDVNADRKQRRIKAKEMKNRGKYLGIRVDWSGVEFQEETKWLRLAEEKFQDGDTNSNENTPPKRDLQRADTGYSHANILFQTKFVNNTKADQEYTMRAEKTTRSICTTEIESTFTKGMELSVKVASPGEIMEANAGYKRELSLTNNHGETMEEELVWGAESQIKVNSKHVAEASLVVDEKKYSGEFLVESKIKGEVYVEFLDKRDNNAFLKGVSDDFHEIIKEYLALPAQKVEPVEFVTVSGSTVIIHTKGKCNFRFGIKQEVRVDQTPIE